MFMIHRLVIFILSLALGATVILSNSSTRPVIELYNPTPNNTYTSASPKENTDEPVSDIAYYLKNIEKDNIERFELTINNNLVETQPEFFEDSSYNLKTNESVLDGIIARTGIFFIPEFFENGENNITLKIKLKNRTREIIHKDTLYFDYTRALNGKQYIEGFNTAKEKDNPISIAFPFNNKEDISNTGETEQLPLGSSCTYSALIVAIGVYDSGIPGDFARVFGIVSDNALNAGQNYDDSVDEISTRASYGEGLAPILNSKHGQVVMYDMSSHVVQDGILRPIYVRNGINTFPEAQGVEVDSIRFMHRVNNGDAGILNPINEELIIIADDTFNGNTRVRGLAFPTEGSMFVTSFQAGVTPIPTPIPGHLVMMHEIGHTLGLDHIPPSNYPNNLMKSYTNDGNQRLESFQLLGLHGNLCGQSVGAPISLEAQSRKFGVNQFFTGSDFKCENGQIGVNKPSGGSDEVGEKGSLKIGDVCVHKLGDRVWWDPSNFDYILSPTCDICIPPSGKIDTPIQVPDPDPVTIAFPNGCAADPFAECVDDIDCKAGENGTCNQVSCQCEYKEPDPEKQYCGDGQINGNEECEPPGSTCDIWFRCNESGGCSGTPLYCASDCSCPDGPASI